MEIQENNNTDWTGYCKLCDSCGEEGCCSPIGCLRQHMIVDRNKDCDYGDRYFRDILFGYKTAQMYSAIFDDLKTGKLELKEAIELEVKQWDNIYEWVYNDKLLDEENQ